MIKKAFVASLLTASMLLIGCGDSGGESRLSAQDMLDSGNYAGVVAKLEGRAVTNADRLSLAAAYMGKAGLGFADVTAVIANSNANGGDGFANFIQRIKTQSSNTALADLGKAIDNYKLVVDGACSNPIAITDSQKDICLFIGLSSSMKAAKTLSYLGDVTNFGANANDNQLTASACAMQYAYNGVQLAGCTITTSSKITFTDTNRTYTPLQAIVNAHEFEYLMTEPLAGTNIKQTALTDGYCKLNDINTVDANKTAGAYVCPVNKSANTAELTAANVLVDVLNDSFNSVVAAVGGTDSSIATDIEKYRTEITGSSSGTITITKIVNYINSQN
ncbi:MAG: hypothetical protein NTW78_12030 [Campylobacterales bacterium]|nr:hypothetical protein [Campylobacterales bacterium]